jgi:hypothetical protein
MDSTNQSALTQSTIVHHQAELLLMENHVDCVRVLVQAGADITIEVDGRTIADFADDTSNSDEFRAALLLPAKTRRRCEQCGTTTFGEKTTTVGQGMKKCGGCQTTYYCNRECQTANWPLHKPVCNAADE